MKHYGIHFHHFHQFFRKPVHFFCAESCLVAGHSMHFTVTVGLTASDLGVVD